MTMSVQTHIIKCSYLSIFPYVYPQESHAIIMKKRAAAEEAGSIFRLFSDRIYSCLRVPAVRMRYLHIRGFVSLMGLSLVYISGSCLLTHFN